MRAAQIGATQVGPSEVALAKIHVPKLERGGGIRRGREPTEHGHRGLHVRRAKPQVGKLLKRDERIGPRVAVRISGVGLLCMLLLPGRAFPHEGGQQLEHGAAIRGGVLGDALQGMDAADAHPAVVAAELLDATGVALSDLSFPVDLELPPRQVGAREEEPAA